MTLREKEYILTKKTIGGLNITVVVKAQDDLMFCCKAEYRDINCWIFEASVCGAKAIKL